MNSTNVNVMIRIKLLIYLCVAIVLHISLDLMYRPFASSKSFFDYGLSSSFSQVTSIAGIACVMLLWEGRNTTFSATFRKLPFGFFIIVPPLSMTIYELIQIWLPTAVFDVLDLLYSFLGGLINWIVLSFLIFAGKRALWGAPSTVEMSSDPGIDDDS